MMKRALLILSALSILISQPGCGPDETTLSTGVEEVVEEHYTEPVAVVNGIPIYGVTYDQILEEIREGVPTDHPESVDLYVRAKLKALEKVIDEELLRQEGSRLGYEPGAEEVHELYSESVERAGSEEEYLAGAATRRLSKSEVLDTIRRTVTIDRFVKEEIDARISTTERDARAFYDSRPDLFTPRPQVRLGQIAVEAPPSWPVSRRAEALSRLSGALERIQRGDSFEDLAREISEDPSASRGGRIGVIQKGVFPNAVESAIFLLQPGEVSGIVESEQGYHLFKVYERLGGRLIPFEEVKEQAGDMLLKQRRGERLSSLVKSLREKATIERLLV